MGYELRRWLADRLPEDITSGERVVALEVADLANERSRVAYGSQLLDVLVHRTGLANQKQVGKVLGKLAAKGVELRVPVRNGDGEVVLSKAGRPLYAFEGRKLTFRVPEAGEFPAREVPPWGEHSIERSPHRGSTEAERSPCGGQEVPLQGDPVSSPLLKPPPLRGLPPQGSSRDEQPEDGGHAQRVAAAAEFLESLPAPWAVGPKTAAQMAPGLVEMTDRQGWALDSELVSRLTANGGGVKYHSKILRIRIDDLPRRQAPPPAAKPDTPLPDWCGDCADGNPAAATTGHIRQLFDDRGNGRPCPKCHPSQVNQAA